MTVPLSRRPMTLKARQVLLRVQNVPWMEHYHGREAGLIGSVVDAIELTTDKHVAYVDNRDGEAEDLVEAVMHARTAGVVGSAYERELETHAKRRFLHGEVEATRR